MESYIDDKKKFYKAILDFLENPEENCDDEMGQQYFKIISDFLKSQEIGEKYDKMHHFLQIIKNISNHHHRERNFINKINQTLFFYRDQIKQTLSNDEIYQIFESNKMIVLYLLKNDILTISEQIYKEMINKIELNGQRYCHFFYPELEKFIGEKSMKSIKNELLDKDANFFDDYEAKRLEGENDSYICSLIRNDSVEDFISHVTHFNYSLSSQIAPSVFETNLFLIKNQNTSLIEYSAFFGSIQIFQYLLMNNVELTSSLWLYTIHSKKAAFVHILESNKVSLPIFIKNDNQSNLKCFIESIKCHHNDFADYMQNNFLNQNEFNSEIKEKILSKALKYYNYEYLQAETVSKYGFFYSCLYKYNELVKILLKEKETEIKSRIIKTINYFNKTIIFIDKN